MDRIKTLLKRLLLAGAALLALAVLLVVLSRLTTPTAAQREAVALMEQDDLSKGPDAFGMLYTLARDVPAEEIETVVAADAATVAAWPKTWDTEGWADDPAAVQPFSERFEWRLSDYPTLFPSQEDRALFCGYLDEMSCLARVRAAPEATAAAIARSEALLRRAEGLRGAEVLRNAMPHPFAPPSAPFDAVPLTTARALTFVQGEEALAIGETCRDLVMLRRLSTQTDMLTHAIGGTRLAGEKTGRLLADMLSEWPVDRPLPASCEAALRPPINEELSMCRVLRGEFRMTKRWLADLRTLTEAGEDNGLDRLILPLLYDDDATLAAVAERWAPYCRAEGPGRQEPDSPVSGWRALLRWPCLGNLGGCTMAALAGHSLNAFGDYADRMRDFGARLRLLGALAWLREQAAATGATADVLLGRLPAELADAEQRIELAPGGRALRVPLAWTGRGEEWAEAPLPAALIP